VPRRFNQRHRKALYVVAGGRCELCGIQLVAWHADHRIPWSRGGETDLINGQALCPNCNLEKGASAVMPLRRWQNDALVKYNAHLGENYLLEATPAAGKTRLAAEIIKRALAEKADLVVVVVPSVALCEQWADVLAEVDVKTRPGWDGGPLPSDYQAATVTYHALGGLVADMIRATCGRRHVLAVLDEIHHCGDDLAWGRGAQTAFEHAVARLGLSGTPFRTDGRSIPFVKYLDGQGVPDYRYGYADALRDSIVRYVYFPAQGGQAEWINNRGERRNHDTADELPEDELNQRLRTLLEPDGGWIEQTLIDAHAQLCELREADADAAGLVVTETTWHADQTARVLAKLTGGQPVVVHNDVSGARDLITRFRKSAAPWMVAVKMVSEGVDIPRLRIGVFAAATTTPMFFRQVVGRFVRVEPDEEDPTAYVFIPDDPRLRIEAEDIREARDHVIVEQVQAESRRDRDGDDRSVGAFTPLRSTGELRDLILPNDTIATRQEVEEAEFYKRQNPETASLPTPAVIKLLRAIRDATAPPRSGREETPPQWRSDKTLRSQITAMVKKAALHHGYKYAVIHVALNKAVKAGSINECSTKQLEKQFDLISAFLTDPEVLVQWLP
jgi:superfamily II DNA or RNA helicase